MKEEKNLEVVFFCKLFFLDLKYEIENIYFCSVLKYKLQELLNLMVRGIQIELVMEYCVVNISYVIKLS